MLGLLSYLAVVVIVMTSLFLLISQNWRWNIIALAVQYLALMILTAMVWPIGMAAVKLIAGWMAGAMLSASQPAPELVEDPQLVRSAVLFRFLAAMLVWILVFTIMPIFKIGRAHV
jgi:Na+-translocating ferredoxin:NAD+ oxidoreductase RnfD subunit